MNILAAVVNGVVIAAVGAILAWQSHGRFRAIDGSIRQVETHLENLLSRVEDRLDNRIDGLQASIEGLRSDLTAVALAVGAHPRTQPGGTRR